MSWWSSSSISSFATSALKNAQERIDKVLDIKDEEEEGSEASATKPSKPATPQQDISDSGDGAFWSSYLGPSDSLTGFTSTPSKSKSVSKPTARAPATVASAHSEFFLANSSAECSDLKTSVTSAFTVRSKRVESTLTKYQVLATKVETKHSQADQADSEKIKSEDLDTATEKTDMQSIGTESALATKNFAPVEKDESEQLIEMPNDEKGCSPSPNGGGSKSEESKQSSHLHLGSKRMAIEKADENNAANEEAKCKATAIVEPKLRVESPAPSAEEQVQGHNPQMSRTSDQEYPVVYECSIEPKAAEWSLALELGTDMTQSAEGSGWGEEDLDIDDICVDREEGSLQAESQDELSQERSDKVIASADLVTTSADPVTTSADPVTTSDDPVTSVTLVSTTEDSIEVHNDEVNEGSPESSQPETSNHEKLTEKSQMEESSQSVDVIDASELCESEMDMNVQECGGTSETTPAKEPAPETEHTEMVEPCTSAVALKPVTEGIDQADVQVSEVSLDSSDTTDAAGDDQLSESSRTLTGDDFHSLQEDVEQKPESAPAGMAEEHRPDASSESKEQKKTGALVSSSYVKTMLEEAMTESVKDTDSHSSSASDKSSEMVRIESGMNSGHTSGDEIDTTTSSDIEIISTPTPNGEYRQERPFDLSPLRHALSRTMRRGSLPSHKRSDSSSSGQSTWSKNGDDLLSPDGGAHRDADSAHEAKREEHRKGQCPEGQHRLKETDEEQSASNNPLETQTLLRDPDDESAEQGAPATSTTPLQLVAGLSSLLHTIVERAEPGKKSSAGDARRSSLTTELIKQESVVTALVEQGAVVSAEPALHQTAEESQEDKTEIHLRQKLAEMAEVLEVREKKLVELSRENIDLHEVKAILKNQLKQSEEAREAELEDLNTVSEEFTTRISDFEEKIHALARERDSLKKQLGGVQTEISKKSSSNSGLERLLQEKDQQVAELLDEGEKLSKQQLTSNNIIKKLRAKEKDNDSLIKSHKQNLEQQNEELTHLRMVLDTKEDLEKRQIEAIGQQNIAVKKQEDELLVLRGELEDMQEKARSLQAALDNSYKEISELHKANAGAASETARAKLSVEMSAKHQLQMAMEQQQLVHKQQVDALLAQIEDQQLGMVRQEREQGRREDVLRQEIADLQQRLQEAEERNQDLTQVVTSATRPLLRQIKNLQSTYDAQSGSYEKVETNLTQRLNEAQKLLAEAVEKERAASEHLMDVTSRLTSVETQVSTLRQDKSHLQVQLEVEKAKVAVLEDAKNSESAHLEVLRSKFTQDLTELKKEKVMLENQLEMEKMQVESERKKVVLAHEQLMDKELQLQRQGMISSPRSITPRSMTPGSAMAFGEDPESSPMAVSVTQDELLEKTLMLGSVNGGKASLYETLRHTGAATLMENLQSQLKMKEGEIVQLQNEIGELERTREAMARELVKLSTANDVLQEQVADFPHLKSAHLVLHSRYNALLQMYGEKEEEAEELSMDLQDVKDMYKAQIEELVKSVR